MKIAVIGGRGHFGRAIVSGLERAGHDVVTAGRSAKNQVRIDLRSPATYPALDPFDAVVNCSDSLAAPPDPLIRHVLEAGGLLIETAGEPVVVRRVLADHRPDQGHRGTVVFGAGIFPGYSALLAGEAVDSLPGATGVELGIRWNPMSAGGGGMVALVPHLLGVSTHQRRGGELEVGPPMGPGPTLPFPDGPHATMHLPFTEPDLLARSRPGLLDIATYGSVDPDVMMLGFKLIPGALMRTRLMRALMWLQFTVLRRGLLRAVPSRVRMVARATSPDGEEAVRTLDVPDGIAAAGHLVAATLAAVGEPPPGLHLLDALTTAAEVRAHLATGVAME